jgi:DNA-binding CsgD family transcriptional regulator
MTVGIVFFFLFMFCVPKDYLLGASGLFPLYATIDELLFQKWKTMPSMKKTSFHLSITNTQLGKVFKQTGFLIYTCIAGLVFGYCFNMWPTTVRSAGFNAEALFGFIGLASLVYLLLFWLVVGLGIAAYHGAKRNKTIDRTVLFITLVFAILFLFMPFMKSNWRMFALQGTVASFAVLFSFIGILAFFSVGDYRVCRRLFVSLMVGVIFGAAIGALFRGIRASDSIVLPVRLEEILFIGTFTVGFLALALAIVALWQQSNSSYFPQNRTKNVLSDLSESMLAERCRELSLQHSLTQREEEIMGLLAQGRSGPFIQEHLYISKGTVKTHIKHIYNKMGINSRQQLIDLIRL